MDKFNVIKASDIYSKEEIDSKFYNIYSNEEIDNKIKEAGYYVPNDFAVGSTVWLDGIECLVIAKDITIQGCSYRNIAIDKNYDLGWYCKYVGTIWGTKKVDRVGHWIWGGYGSAMNLNTSQELGYGYQNTINYLSIALNGTNGTATEDHTDNASLYRGLTDFRNGHSDKWFLPSVNELKLISQNGLTSSLSFNSATGASSANASFWTSCDFSDNDNTTKSCRVRLSNAMATSIDKFQTSPVRLCRVF